MISLNGSRKALIVVPSFIAATAIFVFILILPGLSLIAAFVPAMILAWILYMVRSRKGYLPYRESFTPTFLIALAIQFLHFWEEYHGRFMPTWPIEVFGADHGGSLDLLVGINMAAYCLFVLSFVAVMWYRRIIPAVILWFVIIMMTLGNAIGHVAYYIVVGGYFPGMYTAIPYFVIGPVLLYQMWNPLSRSQLDNEENRPPGETTLRAMIGRQQVDIART